MIETETIKKNFSRYAEYYDSYSNIQDRCGARLADMLLYNGFESIIDIGCGTGNYTWLLRDKFPDASIKAIDISTQMVDVARRKLGSQKIDFMTADAEEISLKENFDLITSNACFQWFENFDTTLFKYYESLKTGGTILFSAFGSETFWQLRQCLSKLYKKGIAITSANFISKAKIKKVLENNFDCIAIEEEKFKEVYASLWELLSTIKYTGTRGAGINAESFGKKQIAELEKIYKADFGNIEATYQIYYCRAQKRESA